MNKPKRHPDAARDARHLVNKHDGHAKALVEQKLTAHLNQGEIDDALRLDQVRREILHVYEVEGE